MRRSLTWKERVATMVVMGWLENQAAPSAVCITAFLTSRRIRLRSNDGKNKVERRPQRLSAQHAAWTNGGKGGADRSRTEGGRKVDLVKTVRASTLNRPA